MKISFLNLFFDEGYYRSTNHDIDFHDTQPVQHYKEIGWLEGRAPYPDCNVLPYFSKCLATGSEPDVNGYAIFVASNFKRRRKPSEIIETSKNSYHSALRLLREVLDIRRYARLVASLTRGSDEVDLVVHFARIGCALTDIRQMLPALADPASFRKRKQLQAWLDQGLQADLPHLTSRLIELQNDLAAIRETELRELANQYCLNDDQIYILQIVDRYFDAAFYLSHNPDVASSVVDPLIHFTFTGWREGRDPNESFSTSFYLQNYVDIRAADVNPFYHFLVAGRSEGRVGKSTMSTAVNGLRNLEPGYTRIFRSEKNDGVVSLTADDLAEQLRLIIDARPTSGVALTFSHDCYLDFVGGTQIFISDEEQGFKSHNFVYLNISPLTTKLFIPSESDDYVVVCNGTKLGVVSLQDLVGALSCLDSDLLRVMAIHSILGHSIEATVAISEALRASEIYFWTHDYTSICVNFNLLRNERAYCNAPDANSMGCRVCIYGTERRDHLVKIQQLFSSLNLTVVSPSEITAEIWSEKTDLPHERILVVPHLQLEQHHDLRSSSHAIVGTGSNPLRVAFIGYPKRHKGFHIFAELVRRFAGDPRLQFVLGTSADLPPMFENLSTFEVKTTPDRRNAAAAAMRRNSVHLVVNPPIWPETFNYVAYESLDAGAFTYTLEDSGNIARMVMETHAGRVFGSPDKLISAFDSGEVFSDVNKYLSSGNSFAFAAGNGTTAAILAESLSAAEG